MDHFIFLLQNTSIFRSSYFHNVYSIDSIMDGNEKIIVPIYYQSKQNPSI